jgi:hydrogenase maturation protease
MSTGEQHDKAQLPGISSALGDSPGQQSDPQSSSLNPQPRGPRLLVLGLGNDLLRDDSIGLRLAQSLSDRLPAGSNVTILQSVEAGLALLDIVAGYDELIIVDAVQTGHAEPGFVHELDVGQLPLLPGGTPHFLGVAEMLALGRELHLPVPAKARVFAVEVEDPYTLEKGLTPALAGSFSAIVALLEQRIIASIPRNK